MLCTIYGILCCLLLSTCALGMVAAGHCPCLPCSAHYHKTLYLYAMGPCRNIDISKLSVLIDILQCMCPIGFAVVDNKDQDRCYCKCEPKLHPYITNCDFLLQSLIRDGDFGLICSLA